MDFLEQICPKIVFPVENRKSEHCHWIVHVWNSLGIKIQPKLTNLGFCINFAQKKKYFMKKTDKREHPHWILHVQISLGMKFYLKLTVLIENRKTEHHHGILHIRIILRTQFQLKLRILIFFFFWLNLPKKSVSG